MAGGSSRHGHGKRARSVAHDPVMVLAELPVPGGRTPAKDKEELDSLDLAENTADVPGPGGHGPTREPETRHSAR